MNKNLGKYYINLSLLTFIMAITAFILFKTYLAKYYSPVFWGLLLFFYLIHLISHSILIITQTKKKINFGNAYLGSFLLKFLSYIIFLIIYVLTNKENFIFFAISLFILYIVYTIFEVRANIKLSKRLKNSVEKTH